MAVTAFYELKEIDPDLRIILCSGFVGNEQLDELLLNGAIGFIPKPFRKAELSSTVDHALRANF